MTKLETKLNQTSGKKSAIEEQMHAAQKSIDETKAKLETYEEFLEVKEENPDFKYLITLSYWKSYVITSSAALIASIYGELKIPVESSINIGILYLLNILSIISLYSETIGTIILISLYL